MKEKNNIEQINSIFESIINMAKFDYSKKAIITDDDSQLNAIASGVNMLSEQLEHLVKKEKEKTDFLNKTQEIAQIGTWSLDLISNELFWSDEIYRIFGIQPQEFAATYEAFLDAVHPDDREKVDAAYSNSVKEGKDGYEIEHRVVQKYTGELIYVLERCNHIRNTSGNIIRSVGFVQNITDYKKREEIILQNELRLNVAQQVAKIGSWDLDFTTGKIIWSEELYRIFNCDPETFTPMVDSLINLLPDECKEVVNNWITKAALGIPQPPITYFIYNADGSIKYLQGQGEIIFNDAGKAIKAYGTVQDITEIKKNEESFQKSIKEISEYKNTLQNQSNAISRSNAIIEFSVEGNILVANDNFLTLFGYQLNEIKGKHHRILVDKKFADTNKYKEFWNHLKDGKFHQGEFKRIRKDGQPIWIQGSYNPIFDFEGKLMKVMKIVTDVTDRKKIEKILQKTLKEIQDYKTALDEASIVAITDVKGIIQYANNNFCKISGFSQDELIGQNHRIINSGYHSKEFFQDLWKTIANGKIWRGDIKNKSKNGTFYWVDTTILPFLNKNGKPYQYLAIRIDITKRKKAEEEITKKNIFLDAIIENIPSMIFVKDAKDFRFVRLNKAGENLLGYNREEMIGKHDYDFFPKEESDHFISQNRAAFVDRKLRITEDVITTLNDKRLLRTQKMPVFDENGLPDYLLGISEDITEQKQVENKLKVIAEKLNEAQEIANSGSWEWNFISGVGIWSENHYKLLEYNENEIKPTFENFLSRIHPDDKHIVEETRAIISIEKKTVEIELRAVMPNGSVRWFNDKIIPVLDKDKIIGLKGVIVDITERKKIQEQLLKVNNELEAFSYSVSHDLRAPLRAIIGFTSILEEDYTSKLDDEAKRITNVIKTNTAKMGRLIDDLLAFSRLGRQKVSKINIHTNALVKEVIDEMFVENNKNIEWVIASLPDSKGDNNLIHQVWVNLISNAVKYSGKKENPRIEIGNFKKEGKQVFFVKDNGAGFDEQFNNKLFKVFQRLHSVDDFEGTGIGLAIVEKIISKHGGSVWAEGEVNKGACFYFSLPIKN